MSLKLRLQCDEIRPKCKQCVNFRVSCNYNVDGLDLQASHDTITDLGNPLDTACSTNYVTLSAINNGFIIKPGGYELDMSDLERLGRFQTRTVLTMGTAKSFPVYQKELFRLACSVGILNTYNETWTEIYQ